MSLLPHAADEPTAVASADLVVPALIELFHPRSVLDVGCGVGTWLRAFQQRGVTDLLGVDAADVRPHLRIPEENFRPHDLKTPLSLGRRFDLVVSLEVIEHLPPDAAATFLDSLVAASDLIVFSAAAPWQRGPGHVNCRWPDHWAGQFESRRFEVADIFRPRFWLDDRIALWYRQNMFLAGTPQRLHELGVAPTPVLPIVHPDSYQARIAELAPGEAAVGLARWLRNRAARVNARLRR